MISGKLYLTSSLEELIISIKKNFIEYVCSIGGASVWSKMSYDSFFSEYVQEGVTEEEPEIYLQIQPMMLVQSLGLLKSTHTAAKIVTVKLTRKHQQPCLSFIIGKINLDNHNIDRK